MAVKWDSRPCLVAASRPEFSFIVLLLLPWMSPHRKCNSKEKDFCLLFFLFSGPCVCQFYLDQLECSLYLYVWIACFISAIFLFYDKDSVNLKINRYHMTDLFLSKKDGASNTCFVMFIRYILSSEIAAVLLMQYFYHFVTK